MRIAVSGTANIGKTTFINDFLNTWSMYTTPEKTYRSLLQDKNHSKKTTENVQWDILNLMIDDLTTTKKGDKIIYDRCPIDNIIYTFHKHHADNTAISNEFIKKCIPLVREAMKFIDVVFFIPMTKHNPIIEDNGVRETDESFIKEIDLLFKSVCYSLKNGKSISFLQDDDRPPLIEIFGDRQERIQMTKLYLDDEGDWMDPSSIVTPEEMEQIENMKKSLEQ